MKLLILSDIPAPYRIAIFKGLSEQCSIDLFFNHASNDQRNKAWYTRADSAFSFDILDNDQSMQRYDEAVKNIERYDVVLCYDPWHKRSRALQRICWRKKIPCVINADGALGINTGFPKKQIKSFYVKRATLCFAGCQRAVEYFQTYGAKPERIIKHPFTSTYSAQILKQPTPVEQKRSLRKELGIDDTMVFITVGQFIPRKGYDLLLEAWGKTKQEGKLYIIGGGPLEQTYLDQIQQQGLRNVVIKGFLKPEQLQQWYRAADVFVMPTREDIWGLVVNEAMANGLPVISSDHCTAGNELIMDGENGYVYPVHDTDRLAQYIEIMTSRQDKEAMSEKAIAAVAKHTYENIIQCHMEALKAIQ